MMEVQPEMSISVLGLLCVGVMAVLFVAMIVGTVVMLLSISDRRFWDGLFKAGLIAVPVLSVLLFLGLFLRVSRTESHRQVATRVEAMQFEDERRAFQESVRARTEREVAEKLREAEARLLGREPETTTFPGTINNDLRPVTADKAADALAALTPTLPAIPAAPSVPAIPNPAGDLRSTVRPDWLTRGVVAVGDETTVVLASALFATEQEAEDAVRAESLAIIENDLLKVVRNRLVRPRQLGLFPTVLQQYQKDRFVEVEQRDLGTVTAPMYRVWKKLELSPKTREQGLLLYRSEASQARFLLVGIVFMALLSVPIAILIGARGTRMTHGRGKRLWQASATLIVLAACVGGYVWLGQHIRIFR